MFRPRCGSNPSRCSWPITGLTWRQSRVEFQNRIAFPAACLVFALLGVPVGVRPRRGGRAAGLILTLVFIGGYYFLWVAGDHMARQGRSSAMAGGVGGEHRRCDDWPVSVARTLKAFERPSVAAAWVASIWHRRHRTRRKADATPATAAGAHVPYANGPTVRPTMGQV